MKKRKKKFGHTGWTHVSTITDCYLTTSTEGEWRWNFLRSMLYESKTGFKNVDIHYCPFIKFDMHLTCTMTDLIRIHFDSRLSFPRYLYKEDLRKQVMLVLQYDTNR